MDRTIGSRGPEPLPVDAWWRSEIRCESKYSLQRLVDRDENVGWPAKVHASIDRSPAEIDSGQTVPFDDVIRVRLVVVAMPSATGSNGIQRSPCGAPRESSQILRAPAASTPSSQAHMVQKGCFAMVTASSTGESMTSSVGRARTLIVDDHPLFRQAFREVLARQPELEVVADVGSVADAIAYVSHHDVDAAIVDIVLPEARGVTFVRHLRAVQPNCKVLALSGIEEPTQMAEMLRAGASGFAFKSQPAAEIVDALRCVLGGARSVPAAARDQIDKLLASPDAWPLERLTRREREIFDLLVAGYGTKDIASKLTISTRTMETHRHRVMHKLAARSLTDLFQLALRHGLV